MVPTKRSAIALARGARTGVLIMRISVGVNTASNAAVNGEPGAGGVRGDAEDVHSSGGVLNDEERIQPAQGMVSRVRWVRGRRFDVAIVGFPRTSSRTRRAPLSAPGAPRVLPGGQLLGAAAGVGVHGVAMWRPR